MMDNGRSHRYVKLYKPFEVLCQFSPSGGKKTLKDIITMPGIYPSGRLDYRSEGLVLLTDDGPMIHRLTSPLYNHPKTYFVQVEGVISPEAIRDLQETILLPGTQTKLVSARSLAEPDLPPRSKPVRRYHPTSWLEIVLYEGKKHQVRRMSAAVGYPTLRLVRVAIGPLTLGGLQSGEWRSVSPKELSLLQKELDVRRTSDDP